MSIAFETVIGLEIHAQISTKSKMFCACSNDSFGAAPNTNVCPICMGFPGMLPVINGETLQKGVLAALTLHCEIPEFSKFDRKNYFYPDLPKGFQISQYDKPISQKGYVDILVNNEKKRIRVHRLHLEDDAGKLVHVADGTLCDFNRSGSPLMEIVSEPDLRSVTEASAYAQEIQRILRYVGASDCDMEKGMMRFDVNVSVREKGASKFGTKVEVKNLNSFHALKRALEYEIKRQIEAITAGEKLTQETRGWDDIKGITVSQRSKEEAHDYRYFPEPDLPPVVMKPEEILQFKAKIPELPLARRLRFIEQYGLSEEDAGILTEDRDMADYFEEVVKISNRPSLSEATSLMPRRDVGATLDAKKAVSFINTILLKHLNRDGVSLSECKISAEQLGRLIALINDGTISNNLAKTEVFEAMYESGKNPDEIVEEKGLKVVSDTSAIEEVCKKIIAENPGPVADFKAGKQNAFGFLVGQAMKAMKGQGNPRLINEVLHKLLQ